MNVESFIKLVNGVGFPIVMSIALFWSNQTSTEANQVLMKEFNETIRSNTDALHKLSSKIEKSEQ